MSTGARTNVSVSYPTKLRATLRAPPSKWAIKAFFLAGERSEPRSRTARRAPADRSPRRAAGRAASVVAVPLAFFGTFFRAERKYCPPRDGSPTVRAGVGASVPPARDSLTAKLPCVAISRGLFARPLHSFGSPTETPKHPVPRRSRRVMLHPWASGMRLRAHKRAFRSPFGNLRIPKLARNP